MKVGKRNQQKDTDRLAALCVGTPDAIRAWAKRYDVPLINPGEDGLLLISIHETRVVMGEESAIWLAANKARIVKEREGQAK